jgi:hypothetical protein
MPGFTQYDVTVAAQSFAQVASILCGFAFVILVWLVDNVQRRQREGEPSDGQTERALIFLVVTFMANLIAAVMWALISGEAGAESSRPGTLNFFVVSNFTLAAPLTFEAMAFFLASAQVRRVIPIFREVFFASVIIGGAFQWVNTRGVLQVLDRCRDVYQGNAAVFTVLLPLTIIIVLIGGILSTRAKHSRLGLNTEASFASFNTAWLAAILASSIAFGLITAGGPDAAVAKGVIWVSNLAWAGLMAWAMIFLPLRQSSST